jgi:hypothetical protein
MRRRRTRYSRVPSRQMRSDGGVARWHCSTNVLHCLIPEGLQSIVLDFSCPFHVTSGCACSESLVLSISV